MLAKAMRFPAFAVGADGREAREEEKAGEGSSQLTGPGSCGVPALFVFTRGTTGRRRFLPSAGRRGKSAPQG
jgi:hypothetical protein